MIRFLKAAFWYARHQEWVDAPEWRPEDAHGLSEYLKTNSGQRFSAALRNTVIRQQAAALTASRLEYEAGYASGYKGMVAAIQGMSDLTQFTETGEKEEDDPPTS